MVGSTSFDNMPGSLSKNAVVGIHLVESIRDILGTIYSRTKRNKRLKSDEQGFINFVCTTACYKDMKDVKELTKYIIVAGIGLSHGSIYCNFKKGEVRAKQLKEGSFDKFSWFDKDSERTKFGEDTIESLRKWLIKDCDLIIHNPNKGEEVYERDKHSK